MPVDFFDLVANPNLDEFYREVERIYEGAWPGAEKFLRKQGYTFGRKEFEEVGFHSLDVVEVYRNTDETAKNIAHEIIEMEEIYRKTGKMVVPRFWSEEQEKKTGISQYKWLTPIHYKAEEIVEKYPDC